MCLQYFTAEGGCEGEFLQYSTAGGSEGMREYICSTPLQGEGGMRDFFCSTPLQRCVCVCWGGGGGRCLY